MVPVNTRTIKLNDCMKGSSKNKKLGINNEQIARFVKVKDHTKTWIKNVEKVSKNKTDFQHQPVLNFDYFIGSLSTERSGDVVVKTPLEYPPNLPIHYSCSYCGRQSQEGFQVEFHGTLTHPYVLRCPRCT